MKKTNKINIANMPKSRKDITYLLKLEERVEELQENSPTLLHQKKP